MPGLVHTHLSIFGGKLFIYFLERVDNTKVHIQLIKGGAVSHTFFHPEAGKPVSSFNTSPQVSGKGRMLHGYPVLSFYPTFQFQCFHFNACGDIKTIFSLGACEKTSVNPPSTCTSLRQPNHSWTRYVTRPIN